MEHFDLTFREPCAVTLTSMILKLFIFFFFFNICQQFSLELKMTLCHNSISL